MTPGKKQVVKFISFIVIELCTITAFAQQLTVQSPNQKINVSLFNESNAKAGEWYLKASYNNNGKVSDAIPILTLACQEATRIFPNN